MLRGNHTNGQNKFEGQFQRIIKFELSQLFSRYLIKRLMKTSHTIIHYGTV